MGTGSAQSNRSVSALEIPFLLLRPFALELDSSLMEPNTLSISVRLRRRHTEATFVSVPITEEVLRQDEEGEGRKLDVDKIIEAALQLGKLESTEWEPEEETEIQLHPMQMAPGQTKEQN